MSMKSQQPTQIDASRMRPRTSTMTSVTSKSGHSRMKQTASQRKSNSRTTSRVTNLMEDDLEEFKHSQPIKTITEVNDTNIDEVLGFSDISSIPTTFLTEIQEDQVYATILQELRKKLPPRSSTTPFLSELTQQKPLSSHHLTTTNDELIHYDTSTTDEISSIVSSSDNTTSSQDGYDTDIETEIVRPIDHDRTGLTQYLELCSQSNIIPCSYFMAHIQDKEMILCYHQFSSEDIRAITKALGSNIVVERLHLDGNYLQQQAAKYISEMIVANDFITELSLTDNCLGGGGEGTQEICRMLTINRNLKKINLSGNKFNELDAAQLIEAFEKNKTLRELDLSHNCFGEECGKMFGAYICGNDSLEAINLSWNNIRGRSAVEIALGIKENVRLKRCNLEMNGFGPDGGEILADCIKQNAALQELNISSNRLNTRNAFSIAEAILVNDSLRVLKIGDNQINSDGALAIFLCVKTNESNILREVDFTNTVVTQESIDTCEDIIKLKDGKFQYQTGKVTPQNLQPNSTSECYIRTNQEILDNLRSNAANAKPHVA